MSPTRVIRRKAELAGELFHSSEALFSSVANLVVAGGYVIESIVLTQGSPRGPRMGGKPKERKNRWP